MEKNENCMFSGGGGSVNAFLLSWRVAYHTAVEMAVFVALFVTVLIGY